MKAKKLTKDMLGLTGSGLSLGIGASILSQPDISSAVPQAKTSISNLSASLPLIGTIMGAKYTLGAVKELKFKKNRR